MWGGLSAISLGGPTEWSTRKRDDEGRDDLPALFSPTFWAVPSTDALVATRS
jgi:hypothetical protein